MTRIKLPYIHEFIARHGEVRRYYRRFGKRIPLPGLPGSEEFNRAYEAALAGQHAPVGQSRCKVGSVSAALAGYYQSLEFRNFAAGTQQLRRAILEKFRNEHGTKTLATMPSKFIAVTLSRMQPHAAKNLLKALRAFCQFAVSQELIALDPTQGIKLKVKQGDGHHAWSELEIEQYEQHHPIGSKARLGFALALFTAQRRSDLVRMGKQHISDGVILIRQQKTHAVLRIPVHPSLQTVLDSTPSEHLTLLVSKSGKPYRPNKLGEQFRAWCNEAGLPQECVLHGLRKAACRRLAEAGASASEIMSISGHKTLAEVERYTREAAQEKMARNAMARIRK
jgi:integrase